MKRIVLSIGILPLIGLMMLLGTVNATAAGGSTDGLGRGLFGTVTSVSLDQDGTGTIELEGGKTIAVTSETTYHVPGQVPAWQTWPELVQNGNDAALTSEVRVAVLLDENLEKALKVMVAKHRVRAHHMGVVTCVNGNTVTMVNKDGQQYTYTFEKGVPSEVAEGKFVTLVVKNCEKAGNQEALAAHNTEQLVLRIRNRIQLEQQLETRERLGDTLSEECSKHITVLEQIRERCEVQTEQQTQTRAALGKAIDDAVKCHEEALQLREQIRTNVKHG